MLNIDKDRVLYYFNEISKIPRESGHEQAVSNWICLWASNLGLEAVQDGVFNIVIRKPASPGYESFGSVILQAHMDMVCEKTRESKHDFAKDPIELKEEDGWIASACGTSLGADNGIGVACAMAVLEDHTLKHPMIEAIFTVEEETTFKGAETVSPELFKGRRMINLDHAVDSEVIAGSCGGTGLNFTMPLSRENGIPEGYKAYKIKLQGLKGGHSGEDIHRGRGNAIELLIRLLYEANVEVVSVSGGTNRLAIPREAEAVVLTHSEKGLHEYITATKAVLIKEYGEVAPNLDIIVETTLPAVPIKRYEFEKAAAAVRLLPNGIVNMSGTFEGVVESSNNLGVIDISGERMDITAEIRGLYRSTVDDIAEKVKMLAKLTDSRVEFFGGYLPWEYKKESVLRRTALETYSEMFEKDMKELIIHAGLECGMFVEKVPEMDIIAIGPDCQFFHSPNERVSISSIRKFYSFLIRLLENLG